jgi:dCTP diphosphatase
MNEDAIKRQLREFAAARDWERFHSPKNLAMALSVEVAELLEQFQWLTEAQSATPDPQTLAAITDEVADVQIYLLRLADRLGIEVGHAVQAKIVKNDRKYPADQVRGRALKYTAYRSPEGD